jgi:hypothetical protein
VEVDTCYVEHSIADGGTEYSFPARKKQGGSQSLNDNAKSKANSAGAMLRRYGEQSLMEVGLPRPELTIRAYN